MNAYAMIIPVDVTNICGVVTVAVVVVITFPRLVRLVATDIVFV